ncbi:MAG: DNA-processing protein DprA [Bacillota bacterium]
MSPHWIHVLHGALGSARAIWEASPARLREAGVPEAQIAAMSSHPARLAGPSPDLERAWRLGCRVFSRWDEEYPAWLRQMPDPPLILYSRGKVCPQDQKAVAVVGTRHPTAYGMEVAGRLARNLAAAGLTVVSGLARGIDTCAHREALAAGGRTIAVLGSGLDRIYPAENRHLCADIATRGAILTEYPPGSVALPYHFPARNRIIAGLALGVVVVEAPLQSGALNTAEHAANLGRPVMAVPGPITSKESAGCNRLIRDGAHLVEGVEDVLAVLGTQAVRPAGPPALQPREQLVWDLLEQGSSYDRLHVRSNLAAGDLAAVLLSLELKGLVRRLPGQVYVRTW